MLTRTPALIAAGMLLACGPADAGPDLSVMLNVSALQGVRPGQGQSEMPLREGHLQPAGYVGWAMPLAVGDTVFLVVDEPGMNEGQPPAKGARLTGARRALHGTGPEDFTAEVERISSLLDPGLPSCARLAREGLHVRRVLWEDVAVVEEWRTVDDRWLIIAVHADGIARGPAESFEPEPCATLLGNPGA